MEKFDIALDMGTNETVIAIRGQGIVLREPSLIVVKEKGVKLRKTVLNAPRKNAQILAIGKAGANFFGKIDEETKIEHPIVAGVVRNRFYASVMLKHFLSKLSSIDLKHAVISALVLHPLYLTKDELENLKEVCYLAGISNVKFMPSSACIPAGFGVEDLTQSKLICEVGASKTEIAIVQEGIVTSGITILMGGGEVDKNICELTLNNYGIRLSRNQARKAKHQVGSLLEGDIADIEVSGIDLETKIPRTEVIKADDIKQAAINIYESFGEELVEFLNKTSEDVLKEILDGGILLCGAASQIMGFKALIEDKTKLNVQENIYPQNVIINGALTYLNALHRKEEIVIENDETTDPTFEMKEEDAIEEPILPIKVEVKTERIDTMQNLAKEDRIEVANQSVSTTKVGDRLSRLKSLGKKK